MQEIMTVGGSAPARPAHAIGTMTRINRFEDLAAGSYWRAKDDVPEKTKPEKRERGVYLDKDHPDYIEPAGGWGASERNRIGSEAYLVDVPVRGSIPADRMHLVLSLKLVDREVHAVVLKGHPSQDKSVSYTFLVDEFLARFELVPEEEAKAIRDAEAAALQRDIADLQTAMIAGPPPEPVTGLLGHQASLPGPVDSLPTALPPKPTVGTMIQNIGHIEQLRETANRAVAIAERHTKWITTHSKEIAEKTQALVPFYQERAAAALASTETVMRYAADLQKGVASLGLYTGEGVEVRLLADGEPAAASEPIRFYRNLIALDEEYMVNVDTDDAATAGADHHDFEDFVKVLTKDEKLMQRIFPFPRMIVLMRHRRLAKRYYDTDTVHGAWANQEANKPNAEQYLLIRNGERLYQVRCDFAQMISALFPTKQMGDQPFRGVDGRTIGMADLDFSKSKGKLDDLNQIYKNLLILIWGLRDRGGADDNNGIDFGPFEDEQAWAMGSPIDEVFQHRFFSLWDPTRDQVSIGTGRPRFSKWIEENNGWLRTGSRVLVMRNSITNRASYNGSEPGMTQPAALSMSKDPVAYEMVARKTKKGHVVQIDATRMVYPRERYRGAYELRQTFDVVLDETHHGFSERGGLQWMCLDMAEASNIDHYLESRLDRSSYMEFYGVLLAARDILRREESDVLPLVDRLEAAFVENDVKAPEGQTPRIIARHAIRLWRAANRGAMPPMPGEAAHAGVYKLMLGSMWTLAGNDHPVEAAETLCADEGRLPLRLALTGKDRFCVYATSVGDEIEDRLFDHIWVTRIACSRKSGHLVPTSRSIVIMPDAVADEEVLKDWDAIANWRGRAVPKPLTETRYSSDEGRKELDYTVIRRAFARVQDGTLTEFTAQHDLELHLAMLNDMRAHKGRKSRSVAQLDYVQPFAVMRTTGFMRKTLEGFSARYETIPHARDFIVLSLQDNPYRMAYRTARTDGEREAVIAAYVSSYREKYTNRSEFLKTAKKAPTIGWKRLAEWASESDDPYTRDRTYNVIPLEANWGENIKQFDTSTPAYEDKPWVPDLTETMVWIDPTAPLILNDLCKQFDWEPVPFIPGKRHGY